MRSNTVTQPQMDLLRKLMVERESLHPEYVANVRSSLNAAYREGTCSSKLASVNITNLMALPAPINTDEIGVYVTPDGAIVKVQQNRAKTGTYAMRWQEISGERLVDATEEHVHGDWVYAPEHKRHLASYRKMTLDEAKAFILRYGRCVRCGRKLKAADSVERGIGPVCVEYFSF